MDIFDILDKLNLKPQGKQQYVWFTLSWGWVTVHRPPALLIPAAEFRDPQDYPQPRWFSGKLILKLLYSWLWVCHSKRIKIQVSQQKRCVEWHAGEHPPGASWCPLPTESQTALAALWNNMRGALPTRKTLMSRVFIGTWSYRHNRLLTWLTCLQPLYESRWYHVV